MSSSKTSNKSGHLAKGLVLVLGMAMLGACSVDIAPLAASKGAGASPLCTPLNQPPYTDLADALEDPLENVLAANNVELALQQADRKPLAILMEQFKHKLENRWKYPEGTLASINWNVASDPETHKALMVELILHSKTPTRHSPTAHLRFWVNHRATTPQLIPTERYFFVEESEHIHACDEWSTQPKVIATHLPRDPNRRFEELDPDHKSNMAGVSSLHGISHGTFTATETPNHVEQTFDKNWSIGPSGCGGETGFQDLGPLQNVHCVKYLELKHANANFDLSPLSTRGPETMCKVSTELAIQDAASITLNNTLHLGKVGLQQNMIEKIRPIAHHLRVHNLTVTDLSPDQKSSDQLKELLIAMRTAHLQIACENLRCSARQLVSILQETRVYSLGLDGMFLFENDDTVLQLAALTQLQNLSLGCTWIATSRVIMWSNEEVQKSAASLVDVKQLISALPYLTEFSGRYYSDSIAKRIKQHVDTTKGTGFKLNRITCSGNNQCSN